MRRTPKATGRQHEDGAIAVETAIVLPILMIFLGLPSIVLAFYFRQYSAAYKAAHDVAIYLSTAPRIEFTTAGQDGQFAALTVARKIAAKELAGIVPDGVSVDPYITCNYRTGNAVRGNACSPAIFRNDSSPLVRFDVAINLPYMNPLTGEEIASMYMSPLSSVRYLGN